MTENEQKKEFLMGYLEAKHTMARLESQLDELKENKLSPSCMIGDGMPHAHEISDLSSYVAKVDELEQEILFARYKKISEFKMVRDAIEKSEEKEKEKNLLTYRYLRGWDWGTIADKMNCGYRHITRLHGEALENFKMS